MQVWVPEFPGYPEEQVWWQVLVVSVLEREVETILGLSASQG